MPKGCYKRTKEHVKALRNHWSKALTDFNKSDAGRKQSAKIGRIWGPINLIAFNKSKVAKKLRSTQLSNYLNSEIGREQSRKRITALNKSEAGRERSRKNIAKVRAMKPTFSQRMLCKSLSRNGIYNKLEWYFPEIHRIGDIAIPSSKIIIEVDGSSHNNKMFFKT